MRGHLLRAITQPTCSEHCHAADPAVPSPSPPARTCVSDNLHVPPGIRPRQRHPAVPPISNRGQLFKVAPQGGLQRGGAHRPPSCLRGTNAVQSKVLARLRGGAAGGGAAGRAGGAPSRHPLCAHARAGHARPATRLGVYPQHPSSWKASEQVAALLLLPTALLCMRRRAPHLHCFLPSQPQVGVQVQRQRLRRQLAVPRVEGQHHLVRAGAGGG